MINLWFCDFENCGKAGEVVAGPGWHLNLMGIPITDDVVDWPHCSTCGEPMKPTTGLLTGAEESIEGEEG